MTATMSNAMVAYGQTTLPARIRSTFVHNDNGIHMHTLEGAMRTADSPRCCCCTACPSPPTAGERSCCHSAGPVFTSLRPISGVTVALMAQTSPSRMTLCEPVGSLH